MLHEPPLIKSYTDIKQFVKEPLHLNYPNHTQSVERAMKLTTTASEQIAGAKRQIGEAQYTTAGRKKQWIEKNTLSCEKLLMPFNKIIAICIALTVFFL